MLEAIERALARHEQTRARNGALDVIRARSAALTPREREVFQLLARGLTAPEIAEQLVLSPHTVHRHVANIRRKLGRTSRTAAVAEAARLGLL